MSDQESQFLKQLRNTIWQALASLLVIVSVAAVPFYFDTQSTISQQEKEIETLKSDKADKEIYELSVRQIKEQLSDINRKLEKIQDRQ
ncbi:hypothetical protein [Gaoshiqia sediminis]|uniref:Uncharacterized protein n=1 Tax=Gaoshiqia sediminis TaxID=2986998 RepID=A0AA41YCM2_9BACT|nr:hypothetical protein [Gaoshiqia sediminis]MCW0484073.1 hypothetical protein [Gaoshiqia sediminis]